MTDAPARQTLYRVRGADDQWVLYVHEDHPHGEWVELRTFATEAEAMAARKALYVASGLCPP